MFLTSFTCYIACKVGEKQLFSFTVITVTLIFFYKKIERESEKKNELGGARGFNG